MKIKELIEILFSALKPGVLPATDEAFAKIDFGAFPILNLPNSCQSIIKNVKKILLTLYLIIIFNFCNTFVIKPS